MHACPPTKSSGNIQLLEAGANPVKKVLLVVTGQESQVRIHPLFDHGDNKMMNKETTIMNPKESECTTTGTTAVKQTRFEPCRLKTELHSVKCNVYEWKGRPRTQHALLKRST
jgi:hypothetical protein